MLVGSEAGSGMFFVVPIEEPLPSVNPWCCTVWERMPFSRCAAKFLVLMTFPNETSLPRQQKVLCLSCSAA